MEKSNETNIEIIGTTDTKLAKLIAKQLSQQIAEIKKSIPQPDELLTREQAVRYLNIDLSTLHLWTKAGKLPAYRLSKRVYYKRSEIDNSLKKVFQNK